MDLPSLHEEIAMPLLLAEPLRQQCAAILTAAGSAPTEAAQVAANLVLANLSGHDSHGVGMLPRYIDAVAEGGLRPNTSVRTNVDLGSLLALDGQGGYGQIVGVQATEMGIARAKQHGSCIVTLAHAHHLGRIGHFAEMATAQGLVSLHFVNVLSRPVVAAWGGGDGRFGTNPCCIGVPLAGAEPFVLDFATSRVAQGKMRVAHNKGERVPPGYLIDEQGRPTDDPGVVVVPQNKGAEAGAGGGLFGALMTFGEHKGYGLAVACELLGGALTGGGTWHKPADASRSVFNGMLTVLIDPAKLGTQASFAQEAQDFIAWLRQSPPGAGFDAVQIAGEPERAARRVREQDGIDVDEATWGEIVDAGRRVGVPIAAA
ncbi:malate/lactate/ureidoglycolate dehydrogenase [soil metagenome]